MNAPTSSLLHDAKVSRRTSRKVWGVVGVVGVLALAATAVAWVTADAPVAPKERAVAAVPVRVTEATQRDLELSAVRRGELDADAAELSARTGGYLLDLSVGLGDVVKEGDILAQVEPAQAESALSEARADVAVAQAAKKRADAQLAAARVEAERGRQAFNKGVISEKAALELESNVAVLEAEVEASRASLSSSLARAGVQREQRRDTAVVAPFDGAVAERYVDQGSIVAPGTPVLRLIRSGPPRVRFRLAERDLALVDVGMRFTVTTQATGDTSFTGKVTRISAEVSRADRTVLVEGALDTAHPKLRPGMYAEVRVALGSLDDAVVVPSTSVVDRLMADHSQTKGVFVIADDVAVWTQVKVRGSAGDVTAVEGVEVGAQVVVLGQNGLTDGSRVRVTVALGS